MQFSCVDAPMSDSDSDGLAIAVAVVDAPPALALAGFAPGDAPPLAGLAAGGGGAYLIKKL